MIRKLMLWLCIKFCCLFAIENCVLLIRKDREVWFLIIIFGPEFCVLTYLATKYLIEGVSGAGYVLCLTHETDTCNYVQIIYFLKSSTCQHISVCVVPGVSVYVSALFEPCSTDISDQRCVRRRTCVVSDPTRAHVITF